MEQEVTTGTPEVYEKITTRSGQQPRSPLVSNALYIAPLMAFLKLLLSCKFM